MHRKFINNQKLFGKTLIQRLKKKKRKTDRRLEMSDSTESKNSLSSPTLLWNIFHRLNCQYCTLICLISIFCVYFEYLNIVLQIFEFGTYGAPEVSDVSLSNWELPFLSNLKIKERKLGEKVRLQILFSYQQYFNPNLDLSLLMATVNILSSVWNWGERILMI